METAARAELRRVQAPLKRRYREHPESAVVTFTATSVLADGVTCSVETGLGSAGAGLHPAAGGDGTTLCSGDMLQAPVACAGVTLAAVATAVGVPIRGGTVSAEGELDFRGTLGVDRPAPVGFTDIRLRFALDTDAPREQLDRLLELTERYCIVLQTLTGAPHVETTLAR